MRRNAKTVIDTTVDELLILEGFREEPYQDTLGNLTFGHGLTWITEEESKIIVKNRVRVAFWEAAKHIGWETFGPLNDTRKSVLIQMIFQLGSLDGWPKFCGRVKAGQWLMAADEMLYKNPPDITWSDWHTQTPSRCETLAIWMIHGEPNARLGL